MSEKQNYSENLKTFILNPIAFAFLFDVAAIFLIQTIDWYFQNGLSFSGMCPAAPTDIPPYRCDILHYIFIRGYLNPWAIAAHIILGFIGLVIAYIYIFGSLLLKFIVKKIKKTD
ncbi:MAG: hypothetical protein AB1782_09840 [Cyanobacteriota bacterium]